MLAVNVRKVFSDISVNINYHAGIAIVNTAINFMNVKNVRMVLKEITVKLKYAIKLKCAKMKVNLY